MPASGSHFSIALATNTHAGAKAAEKLCTFAALAEPVDAQTAVASNAYRKLASTETVAKAAAEAPQRRTLIAAPVTVADGAIAA